MKPQDIDHIRTPGFPCLAPDGSRVLFVDTSIEGDVVRSTLWVVPAKGGEQPRRLTDGPRDTAPAWSPDGRWIAFLRAEGDGPHQLHVMPGGGGAPRRLTDHEFGVGSPVTLRHARGVAAPVWSPDSTRLAYVARVRDPGAPASHKRIDRLHYRIDDLGFVHDRRSQVFVASLEGAAPTLLGNGEVDHWDVSWHPEGSHVVVATVRHDDYDLDEVNDVVTIGLDGTERRLTAGNTTVNLPTFSPDGAFVYFVGIGPLDGDRNDARGRNVSLWRVPASGGTPQRLTDAEPHDFDDGRTRPLLFDGDSVLAGRLERGAVHLCRIAGDGGVAPLIAGRRQVLDYHAAGGTIAAVVADEASAGEIVVLHDGTERVLTSFGSRLTRLGLRPMEEIGAVSPDGYPVHGWLIKPEGKGPFPLLLHVHGGPDVQAGYSLFDEAQVCAGAGFAVLIGNPRGSAGYGEAHARAIRGRLGTVDADDLVALCEAVRRRPDIDGTRCGVTGGSYGGFMTAWLAAHQGRLFKAALCERGVYSWPSMMGTSDISMATVSMVGSDPSAWIVQSPLSHVEQIDIPVMIMHWEGDCRVAAEQAQQLFAALRSRRKQVEFLLFPGGSHNTSRNGAPAVRRERLEIVIRFFRKHLTDGH